MFDLLTRLHAAQRRRRDHLMFQRRSPGWGLTIQAILTSIFVFAIIFVRVKNGHLDIDQPDERPALYIAVAWIGVSGILKALAYRRGWLHGRACLRSSMYEATLHDMEVDEWMNAELDRDARALGYKTFDRYIKNDGT